MFAKRGEIAIESISVCYADAWESLHPDEHGYTFTPRNPLVSSGELPLERGRRIDHILVRCGDHGPPSTLRPARLPSTNRSPVFGPATSLASSRI